MSILYLSTGLLFALLVPVLQFSLLQFKGFVYFTLIILFLIFLLAYVFLSAYKYKIAKIDFVASKKIISWNIGVEEKKSYLEYFVSLIVGICLGIILAIKRVNVFYNIFLSLALAFIILGWWTLGKKRLKTKQNESDSFLLSHIGMILGKRVEIFDGYSKGILNVVREEDILKLTLLNHKKQEELSILIPEDKVSEVDTFLNDLKEHFDNNEE